MSTSTPKPAKRTKVRITLIPGGLLGAITLILLCAKIWGPAKMQALSWWYVFLPLWAGPAVLLGCMVALIVGLISAGLVWFICWAAGKVLP